MRKTKLIIFFSVLLLSFSFAFAQAKLRLDDCLKLAFSKSHLLKASGYSVQSAKAALAESRAQRLPSLTLSSMYTRIGKITSFSIPMGAGETKKFQFGTPNRVSVDLKLQLPLFTWGRVSSTIELAQAGASLSQLQQHQQRLSLTAQVLQGYYAVLLNEEVIRLHESNVERAQHHFDVSKKKFDAGIAPRLQMMQAEVQLKNARTQLQDARGNLQKSLIFMGKLIGKGAEKIVLADSIRYEAVDFDEGKLIETALAHRSDLEGLRLRQQMSQSQMRLANSGNKPSLFFFSGYNVTNGFDPMDPDKFVDNYNAGVQLAFPLFDGFATNKKVAQARLDYEALLEQEKEAKENIKLQMQEAIIALRQAEAKIAAQKENIRLARETLKTAEIQYRDGLVASLDVLDAQQMLNQAELLHVQAIFNHIMAKLAICRATEDFSWFEVALH
ncbi:hypothetical protein B6D60_09035 [candidate division KSB1 bacterium 4484_87]|nr:MAG: hypothetical protein B6D60_09035 [candidate division KSB1 bacterium 4484_87]